MELLLDWKALGSLLATFIFIRTAIIDFLPPEVHQALKCLFSKIFTFLKPQVSIIIEEFDNSYTNDTFDAVQSYLSSKCFSSAQVLKLSKSKNTKNLTFTMDTNQNYEEIYNGFRVNWSFHSYEKKTKSYYGPQETRYFQLSFHRNYKDEIQLSYIPHVLEVAEIIKFKNRERNLYTNQSTDDDGRLWSKVPFSHPSTFDTLAIDPILKDEIKEDLTKFVNRKEFYSRVGRAWKRGYLLYGPPGTGKTSLIAAIANFLEFDIYDLELTAVTSNSQLRKLLISTSSKSVIIVEDIDCSLDLSDRKNSKITDEDDTAEKQGDRIRPPKKFGKGTFERSVSLSGVLNFVDGLWSSCGGEKLMIFTTNHKEKLDQALLRPGRMDKHINLSYCEIPAFKTLMKNYLNVDKHELIEEVEEMLPLIKMTPADIGEIFMSCEEEADIGMKNVVEVMKKRLRAMEDSSNGKEQINEDKDGRTEKPLDMKKKEDNVVEQVKQDDSVEEEQKELAS